MKIENNILKHYLKNVYWIGGTACAGKTTMSRTLAEKYNFYHYNADEMYQHYRKIAVPERQPYMCKHFEDLKAYFSQPLDEYMHFLEMINRESFGMLLLDIIKISENQTVIVEGHYPPELMKELASHDRIAFMMTDEKHIRKDYFDREDKICMLNAIRDAGNEMLLNHVLDVVVKSAASQVESGIKHGYKTFERNETSTVESTLEALEKHFKLDEKKA